MGTYYNPPDDLPKLEGVRKIEGDGYESLVTQLGEDELLFGLYDRVFFKNAVHLYSEGEYNEFERQGLVRLGFYAVPSKHIAR